VVLRHRLWQCIPIVVALLAGCGENGGVEPPASGPPAALALASGGGQSAPAGDTLAAPLLVVVVDSADRRVPGVAVSFSAASNAGSLVPSASETNARGEIAARWVLGAAAGPLVATASVAGLPPLGLSATAVAGPADPSRSTISADPATLAVGDSTIVQVTAKDRFGNTVAGAEVLLSVDGPGGALTQPTSTDANGVAVGVFRPSAPAPTSCGTTTGANFRAGPIPPPRSRSRRAR